MKDFRKLKVWENSHKLALNIYEVTKSFPDSEKFGLTSQLRRAATSVPTNIAEGCGFDSDAQLKRFLHIASGSTSETEYLIILAAELGYLQNMDELLNEVNQVKKMLNAFTKTLNTKS